MRLCSLPLYRVQRFKIKEYVKIGGEDINDAQGQLC